MMKQKTTTMPSAFKSSKGKSPRLYSVYSELHELACRKGPGAKLPTTRELMEILDTSWTTLKPALKELEARNIIHKRQGSGIYVSPSINNKTIAVVIYSQFITGDTTSPFWGRLLGALMTRAQERTQSSAEEYRFFYVPPMAPGEDEHRLPEDFLSAVRNEALDGVISIGGTEILLFLLRDNNIPHVAFAGLGAYMIVLDQVLTLHDAVKALAERGCRRIGFWELWIYTGLAHKKIRQELRLSEYRAALEAASLPYIPHLTKAFDMEHHEWYGSDQNPRSLGYDNAYALWSDPHAEKPDGLVILDDIMTSGVLIAFTELGVKLGRDIHVASHANARTGTLYPFDRRIIRMEFNILTLVDSLFDFYDRIAAGESPADNSITLVPTLRFPEVETQGQENL